MTIDAFQDIGAINARLDPRRYRVSCVERRQISESLKALFGELVLAHGVKTAFEIGAFEASFSRAMAKQGIRAVAFEANPDVHGHFSAAVTTDGVEYVNRAVSDREGELELSIPTAIKGAGLPTLIRMSSVRRQKLADTAYRAVRVTTTSLDAWRDRGDYLSPYAMWIDVEGAQELVLAGAAKTLERTDLVLIELENRPIWEGQQASDAIEELLGALDLRPVARDIERPHQFNGLFARSGLAGQPIMAGPISRWLERTYALLGAMT